jgi:hypothetical protein
VATFPYISPSSGGTMSKYVYCENCGEVFNLKVVSVISFKDGKAVFSCLHCPANNVESKVMG